MTVNHVCIPSVYFAYLTKHINLPPQRPSGPHVSPKSLSQGKSPELHVSVSCLAHTKQHGQSGRAVTRPVEQSAAVIFFSHGTLSHLQFDSLRTIFAHIKIMLKSTSPVKLELIIDPGILPIISSVTTRNVLHPHKTADYSLRYLCSLITMIIPNALGKSSQSHQVSLPWQMCHFHWRITWRKVVTWGMWVNMVLGIRKDERIER